MQKMAAHPNRQQLYPADCSRAKDVTEWKSERFKEEVRGAFKRLQDLCQQNGHNREKALADWCQEYTETNFPRLGEVAYAVPHFFIGRHSLTWCQDSLCFRHNQESDFRGDIAQSKVGRGLRLLNEELERGRQKTMLMMGNVMYENVLIWLDGVQEKTRSNFQESLHRDFAKLIVPKNADGTLGQRYYTRRDVPTDDHQRGEPDILVLHEEKGVVFIQVKALGLHPTDKGVKKKEQAYRQLREDERVFNHLFQHHGRTPEQQVCKVFALPNLSKADAIARCQIEQEDGIHLLSKDDLYEDGMECAEREYSLEKLRQWWNSLPDQSLSENFMKDIIARFIGTLSKPRDLDSLTERTHVRTVADSVRLAGRMFKTMGFYHSEQMKKALTSSHKPGAVRSSTGAGATGAATCDTSAASNYRRVHIKGPPGSGRTTLLILKALEFLKTSGTPSENTRSKMRHAIVLNLYRGLKGRPIGLHIANTIKKAGDNNSKNRVHHLAIDLLDVKESFTDLVSQLFSGVKAPEKKDMLFIVDEMLDPAHYWPAIFRSVQDDFRDSVVWCADGLSSQDLPQAAGFTVLQTECMYRLPVSVQKVLYHADTDEARISKYLSDAGQNYKIPTASQKSPEKKAKSKEKAKCKGLKKLSDTGQDPKTPAASQETPGKKAKPKEKAKGKGSKELEQQDVPESRCNVCTNGPIAVCVRHQGHDTQNSILDCEQCAEDLAKLLGERMNLVEQEQGVSCTHSSHPLPCSVVLLFSIPRDLYQPSTRGRNLLEIEKQQFLRYAKEVQDSRFIARLKQGISPVQLLTSVSENDHQDFESEDSWNQILVSWVDVFQGPERDVVVFLPGDVRKTPESGLAGCTSPTVKPADEPACAQLVAGTKSPTAESATGIPSDSQPHTSSEDTGSGHSRSAAVCSGTSSSSTPSPTGISVASGTGEPSQKTSSTATSSTRGHAPAQAEASPETSSSSCGELLTQASTSTCELSTQARSSTGNLTTQARSSTGNFTTQARSSTGESSTQARSSTGNLATQARSSTGNFTTQTSASPNASPMHQPSPEASKALSSFYWRARDIRRYTDWDKHGLVLAATRCTSQLICIVP